MADKPSGARNFFGRVVDRILPGTNYNRQTGQYSNVGTGLAGLGARLIATSLAGPAAGALVGRAANYLIDRNGNQIGPVQREGVPITGAPVSVGSAFTAPSPMAVNDLGIGAQRPGGSWYGYTGGAGSMGSFGNNQLGNGMASVGPWAPQSTWGQSIASNQGSNLNFGNMSPGAVATGGGGTGRGGSTGANRSMQTGSFSPSSGMGPDGARGSFLQKINRRGLNIN